MYRKGRTGLSGKPRKTGEWWKWKTQIRGRQVEVMKNIERIKRRRGRRWEFWFNKQILIMRLIGWERPEKLLIVLPAANGQTEGREGRREGVGWMEKSGGGKQKEREGRRKWWKFCKWYWCLSFPSTFTFKKKWVASHLYLVILDGLIHKASSLVLHLYLELTCSKHNVFSFHKDTAARFSSR